MCERVVSLLDGAFSLQFIRRCFKKEESLYVVAC